MKVVNERNDHLYLTKGEKDVLTQASRLLDKLARAMDREYEVKWCRYDDEEVWMARDIVDDLLDNAEDEDGEDE